MADLMRAVVKLHRRAEDDEDDVLVATFVDVGLLSELLQKTESQIIFGRRGTGKTHALKYLHDHVRATQGYSIYIDMRRIGSTGGLYSDPNLALQERATRLLLDVLGVIHEGLTDYALDLSYNGWKAGATFELLDELASEITSSVRVSGPVEVTHTGVDTTQSSSRFDAALELPSPRLRIGTESTATASNVAERTVVRAGSEVHRVHFGALSGLVP